MGQSIKNTELTYLLRDPTPYAIKNKTSWNISAIKQLEWYHRPPPSSFVALSC